MCPLTAICSKLIPHCFYVIAPYAFPLNKVSAIIPCDTSDQKGALAFLQKTVPTQKGQILLWEHSVYKQMQHISVHSPLFISALILFSTKAKSLFPSFKYCFYAMPSKFTVLFLIVFLLNLTPRISNYPESTPLGCPDSIPNLIWQKTNNSLPPPPSPTAS